MNRINLFLIFMLCFFCIAGCGKGKDIAKKEEAIPVKVVKIELKNIQNSLDYVGDIKAQDEAKVYPKVNGKIIEKLANDGDAVKKGDVIAYVDRDEVGFKFEKAPVESPLTGIIGRVYVDKGATVTAQTAIALVVDMDKVKVNLNIPEEYLSRIAIGESVEITLSAYPEEKFFGKVSLISPVLDLETRTAPVEISIANSGYRLKSGMFVQARLILEEHKNVPVIAKEAVMGKAPDFYVYVISENLARQKNVKLGIRQGADYEVVEGLKEGDLVVVMGQQKLSDGASVIAEQ